MPDSSTTLSDISARTGAKCQQTGPYRSSRNAQVIVFVKAGDTFPPDADGASTVWRLVTDED
jgi:hypothetical protein